MDSTIVVALISGFLTLIGIIATSTMTLLSAARLRRSEERRAHAEAEAAERSTEAAALRAERERLDARYEHLLTVVTEENRRLREALCQRRGGD